jgi:hypothetical protein
MLSTYFFIGGLSPFELGSPAKSLRLQVCHIFCNPRSQPLCFISATEDVCLHSPKPLNHSAHKSTFRHFLPIELPALSLSKCTCLFPFHRAKKCAKPSCFQQRSFPCFLILRHHSTLPPSLNSQSARAHRQYFASIL